MHTALFALIATVAIAASPSLLVNPFSDVSEDHVSYDAITSLSARNIISGYPSAGSGHTQEFRPDAPINRAEFVKIVVGSKAHGQVIETCLFTSSGAIFSDVPRNEWFAKYVCVAKNFELVYGYPDGTFRPEKTINVAEASTILARTSGILMNPPQDTVWYRPFMASLLARNAIPPSAEDPNKLLTRGEMAEMMWRIENGPSRAPSPVLEVEE